MSLQDFMKKLQEQDDNDIVYSPEPEHSIKIIPPSFNGDEAIELKSLDNNNSLKVIPPTSKVVEKKPTVIKFKLNNTSLNINNTVEEKPVKQENKPTTKQENTVVKQKEKPKENKKLTEEEKVERLFRASGTQSSKRDVWYEYYNQALKSKKRNSVVERIREGKFAITQNNQVLILPDYDVINKKNNEIFKDKWI